MLVCYVHRMSSSNNHIFTYVRERQQRDIITKMTRTGIQYDANLRMPADIGSSYMLDRPERAPVAMSPAMRQAMSPGQTRTGDAISALRETTNSAKYLQCVAFHDREASQFVVHQPQWTLPIFRSSGFHIVWDPLEVQLFNVPSSPMDLKFLRFAVNPTC